MSLPGLQQMATSMNGYQTSQGLDRLRSTASDVIQREQVSNRTRKREREHECRTCLKILEPADEKGNHFE